MAVALILMVTACGALASGNPSVMPPYAAPDDGAYYKDSNAVQLQWLVPTDTENDTVEMKVVFFGPQNTRPAPINPSTLLGASSEVAALKPMFSVATPVSTNPGGPTPPGTTVTFQILPVLPVNLTEGKWWWDVYTWDGSSYSSPQRVPRSFVLDYTAPNVTNMAASNPKFSTSSNAVKKNTTLSYSLSETSDVTIEVLNSANLVVAQLENGIRHDITAAPNPQTATWNGTGAATDGKYTIRVRAVDLAGNNSVEQSVTVEVVNTPPGVSYVIPGISPTPFSPLPASPGIKDITTVTYSVSDTSEVGAVIYPQGQPTNIKKVLVPKTAVVPAANFSVQWDGTEDLTGNTCTDGVYIIAITATNEVGLATTATRNVTVDVTGPTAAPLTINPSPFSPNMGTGTTTISYTLNESATIEIIIKNQARTTTIRTLQAKMLIAAGIQQIQWDGRDSGSAVVTDGIYAVEINAEDGAGNTSTTVGNVRVDTQGPIIAPYSVTPAAISPNGDGVTDVSTISYTISKSGTVEIRIISTTGPQVRQFITQHANAGTYTKDWDGRDSIGNVVSEGDYRIELYLTDNAGNIGAPNPATLSISVDITPPTLNQVTVVPPYFSPGNSPGAFDTVTLNYNISETSSITIKVLDSSNGQIKVLTNNITQAAGLHNIVWDGKDDAGTLVSNGIYHFEIGATDPALNKTTIPQFAPLPPIPAPLVQVDNDGPVVNILSATTPFAPGSQDPARRITTVTYQITDAINNPALCTAEILVKTKLGALVRTLLGSSQLATGVIGTITWDGKNTLGQIVEDGTYAVYINASDPAGNPSAEASIEVSLQNKGPNISSIRYRNNRNTIDTDDTIEITFDRAINDSALNGVNVTTVFAVIGTGTFGAGAILDTGIAANDNILEIRLGNGYIKFKENADTIYILTTTDRIRSYLTGVISTDNTPHLVLDGSPPYLISSSYVDIGNDGMNKNDQILLTFNESVSIANNSPSAVQVLPPGKGYNIGGGANLSNGGTAAQIVVTLGDIDTTSIYIPGVYDPAKTVFLPTEKVPTGINVVSNQNSIVDTAGNLATPNLNVAAQPLPGVDISSSDSTRPKVVYARYSDANTQLDKGGLSAGDMIYVGFDKAILVDANQAANTDLVFKLPVSGNSFGFGATFKYTGVKEIAVTLGGVNPADTQPKITVKGTYLLGNNEAKNAKGEDNPSGLDITTDISTIFQNPANYPITDLAGNLVTPSGIPVDIGSVDTTAPQILVAKFTSEPNVGDNLINPSPDSGFKLIAITDDTTLKGGAKGDVKIDISSIYPDLKTLVLSNKEGNTFKTDLLQTPSGITGAKSFTVTAEDFSGNVSQPYTFTAYVVEPASEVKGEINPSSVTKKTDPLALPEEFILTLLPKIESYNVGIDQIIIQHPGGGYTYSADTIDVFVGTKKLEQITDYTYTKTESGSLFTITLTAAAKVISTNANQKITVKFKMNVPTLPNSPAGTYFTAWVTDTAFSQQQTSPYKQVAMPANVDDNNENNNKFKVVVSDIGIDSVKTKLDYSEFFWRINFEVKFSKELSTAVNPTCFYQPENIVPALGEIPVQFIKFENKIDTTTAGNPVKAVLTGYARVPIDNVNYLNSFTFLAKGFYDTENVLIAKVYKKNQSMSTGFITTAFSHPVDERDLLVTVMSTTAVTPDFQLGIRQPGKNPIYKLKSELLNHANTSLYTYKYRIDENYSSQIDMSIMNPGEAFPASAPLLAKTSKARSKISAAPGKPNMASVYSVKVTSSNLSSGLEMESPDGLFKISKDREKLSGSRLFMIAPQNQASGETISGGTLARVGGIYMATPAELKTTSPYRIKFKPNPDHIEYLLNKGVDIAKVTKEKTGVYKLTDAGWKMIPGEADADGTFNIETSELGTFGLFADITNPEIVVEGGSEKNSRSDIIINIADTGSGISQDTLKIIAGSKSYNIKPGEIKTAVGGLSVHIPYESIKSAVKSDEKNIPLAFVIADNAGNTAQTGIINYQIAPAVSLAQSIIAYPNPAKTFVNIQYLIAQNAEEVSLKIYDSAMHTVYNSDMNPAGASNAMQSARWNLVNDDGERVANGVYYYKIKIVINGEKTEKTGKIAVLR